MNQPTITCPHCEAEITLTESLADPLIRATRKKIAEKEAEVARRESAIGAKRAELAKAVELIEQQFTTRLETERERIAAEEAEKARLRWATDLERKSQEVADLQRVLQERDNKLAEGQKAQTELIRKQQELVDAKREMDLQIETRVQDSLHKAKQEALKVSEKEEQTASMQRRQIGELELIYQYLSGPRFRRRIEAIVEKFSSMQTYLERERKAMTRLRAKREEQIRGVIESTVGMYGDLQGITGSSLEDIDGLVQIARRIEARRKRGLAPRRITEPIPDRGRLS
ncbi:MAG TPA: DUF2130 domain-containing protein [Terrimicrobiaceae bacterium]|nr:DUF2130 domain-containing protein [Terrimicrobiaceae bacterium]